MINIRKGVSFILAAILAGGTVFATATVNAAATELTTEASKTGKYGMDKGSDDIYWYDDISTSYKKDKRFMTYAKNVFAYYANIPCNDKVSVATDNKNKRVNITFTMASTMSMNRNKYPAKFADAKSLCAVWGQWDLNLTLLSGPNKGDMFVGGPGLWDEAKGASFTENVSKNWLGTNKQKVTLQISSWYEGTIAKFSKSNYNNKTYLYDKGSLSARFGTGIVNFGTKSRTIAKSITIPKGYSVKLIYKSL